MFNVVQTEGLNSIKNINYIIDNINGVIDTLSSPINIVIESPGIGVGKTTLCQFLAKNLNSAILVEELVDKRVLKALYGELAIDSKASDILLKSEIYFFFSRVVQAVLCDFDDNKVRIFDRSVISSLAFSYNLYKKGNISEKGFNYLEDVFSKLDELNFFTEDNTIVYNLNLSMVEQLLRIKERGRLSEKSITAGYLESVEKAYNIYVWNYFEKRGISIEKFNWSNFNRYGLLEDVLNKMKEMDS